MGLLPRRGGGRRLQEEVEGAAAGAGRADGGDGDKVRAEAIRQRRNHTRTGQNH